MFRGRRVLGRLGGVSSDAMSDLELSAPVQR